MQFEKLWLAASTALPLCFSLSAWAADNDHLEEVIVTAQRREQNVMAVPMSIQAVSGDQLSNAGIHDLTSLQLNTPGYLTQTDSGFTQIYIRGIGNAIYIGADPSVATFVDDVPRIYGSMADNLVDVERVEVLKGAQGGLYGRNATGGVVNVITHQPSLDAFKGDVLGSYGTKNTMRIAGFVNLPLSDNLAWSISADRDKHDAYVENTAKKNPYTAAMFPTGSPFGTSQQTADFFNAEVKPPELNTQDFWAARSKLLFKPTENFSMTLAADAYDKHDTNGGGLFNTSPAYTQAAVVGLFASLGVNAVLPPGFVQGSAGDFKSGIGFDTEIFTREDGLSLTAVWNAPGFDITSITAYREQTTKFFSDTALTSVPTVILGVNYHKHFTYQELRAVSSFEGPWHVLGGATYLSNRLVGATDVALLSRAIPIARTQVADDVDNWSVYGEVGYDFSNALTLTGSGRYMRETNHADFSMPVVSSGETVQKKFVPSATLSYKIGDGTAYARWAKGFKTGGINIVAAPIFFPSPTDGSRFGPETVDTYEVGFRQSLFDRTVQLTSALFYNDYKNLQVEARARPNFPAITTALINAASARTWGVEAGVNWRVMEPLTLGVNAGYLNAKFQDFKLSGSTVLSDFDRSGAQMPKAPKLQLAVNAQLDHPLTDRLRLVSNLLVSYTGSAIYQYSAVPGVLPDAVADSYWITNLRVAVVTNDDKYSFAITADNLFDKDYANYGSSSPYANSLSHGSPRIVQGEVKIKF